MYFGPITGTVTYKWVEELIRVCVCVCGGAYKWGTLYVGGGGGAYKQQFPVPGLKTTSDVTHTKNKGFKITELRKT